MNILVVHESRLVNCAVNNSHSRCRIGMKSRVRKSVCSQPELRLAWSLCVLLRKVLWQSHCHTFQREDHANGTGPLFMGNGKLIEAFTPSFAGSPFFFLFFCCAFNYALEMWFYVKKVKCCGGVSQLNFLLSYCSNKDFWMPSCRLKAKYNIGELHFVPLHNYTAKKKKKSKNPLFEMLNNLRY